jgi:O-antigen/teichoic acid export membrane protein
MSAFFSSAFYGLQNFKITSIVGSFINLIQLILTITFIILDLGLKALLAIPLISSLLYALLLAYYLYPTFSIISPFKMPKEFKNRIISYTLSIYWTIVLSLIVWQKSEIFFLKIYSTSEAIAFYNIAFNIAMIMIGLAALFSTVIFPVFSSYYGAGDREGIQNIYNKSIKAIFIFYLPICIIVIVAAKPIVSVMYSSQFLAVSPLLIILMASSIFSALGILFANLILAVNRADIQAKYVTLIALTNIILDFILIPHYGATGAALANSSIRIMAFPIWMWIIRKQLGFHYPARETFRCIVPNIPLAIILYFIGNHYPNIMGISLVLGVSLFLYPFLLFIFKTITIDDARIIKEILKTLPAPYEKIISAIFNKMPIRQDIP